MVVTKSDACAKRDADGNLPPSYKIFSSIEIPIDLGCHKKSQSIFGKGYYYKVDYLEPS